MKPSRKNYVLCWKKRSQNGSCRSPWTGFRFGFSYSNGPFRFTIGGGRWYRGGWWGPGRYRGYRRGYRHGYRKGRNAGYRAGYRTGRRNAAQQNLYRNQRNQARTTNPSATAGKRAQVKATSKRDNNVFTDRDGNVHRKTDQGWQERTNEGWKSEKRQPDKSQKPAQSKSSVSRPNKTQDLERSNRARQQGDKRTGSYNKARQRGGGRSGGGGRGGGRR
jgi:hypothetical protein